MKNTEVSSVLGQLWRDTPTEKKRSYTEREMEEREQYKIEITEWRKQQEMIHLTGKVAGTPSSSLSIVENDGRKNTQPVILEDSVAACVHDGGYETHHLYPYASHDPNTSQVNYGESVRPSNMVWYGQHQYHQHPRMYPECPPEEQYTNHYTKDVYPSGPGHYPQQYCRHLVPHHQRSNSANDRDLNPSPFPNNYGLAHLELHEQQHQGDYNNCIPPLNSNDHNLEYHP